MELKEVLCIPAIEFHRVDGIPTSVVAYTTDVPMFAGVWGQPLLLGPGSIHVAHTAEERVAKRDLSQAVDLYADAVQRLVADMLRGVNSVVSTIDARVSRRRDLLSFRSRCRSLLLLPLPCRVPDPSILRVGSLTFPFGARSCPRRKTRPPGTGVPHTRKFDWGCR